MEIKQLEPKEKVITFFGEIKSANVESAVKEIAKINLTDQAYARQCAQWAAENKLSPMPVSLTPIEFYLSTCGGSCYDGLSLFDVIEASKTPITAAILMRMRKILEVRDDDDCTSDEAVVYLDTLMEMNPDTSIAKTWYKYLRDIHSQERLFYAVMAYRYYYLDDDRIGLHDIDDYFTEDEFDRLRGAYKRERLDLQTEEVIEYVGEDGMYTKDYFRIKDEIKNEMLADLGGIKKDEKRVDVSASRKLSADAIGPKELFYNQAEGRQVAQLKDLMSAERYDEIRGKLREKGLRTGFTCLFYGSPGTGKTETVYQIARSCGRDLFIVDVSQIKSCWVGESETLYGIPGQRTLLLHLSPGWALPCLWNIGPFDVLSSGPGF